MPSKNVVKIYAADQYYHVYNRGVAKQTIFHDADDYGMFLGLLKRHLDIEPHSDKQGRQYEHLSDDVELVAYCLMPNHFHLLFYLHEEHAITKLLRAISTAYTVYYNRKYDRIGGLFQGSFKASRITSDAYLSHVSRYIHLNPRDYQTWDFSSYQSYLGNKSIAWLKPNRILELHDNNTGQYKTFVSDHEGYKRSLEEVACEIADR